MPANMLPYANGNGHAQTNGPKAPVQRFEDMPVYCAYMPLEQVSTSPPPAAQTTVG